MNCGNCKHYKPIPWRSATGNCTWEYDGSVKLPRSFDRRAVGAEEIGCGVFALRDNHIADAGEMVEDQAVYSIWDEVWEEKL